MKGSATTTRPLLELALLSALTLVGCASTPSPCAEAGRPLSTPAATTLPPAQPRHCDVDKAPAIAPSPAKAGEVSVEQLSRMLPRHPIVVGFDVDDTLVFSAPAFNALQPGYDPDVIRPKDLSRLTPEQQGQYHAFWNELNEHADDASIPKKIGQVLLDLHIARGDDVFIISRRQATAPPSDAADRRLERFFHMKLAHALVQTNLADKTKFLCERRIDLYYGDSDSDVAAAFAAGATPVRVKRAADSYAKDPVHNGELDEIVLAGSEE